MAKVNKSPKTWAQLIVLGDFLAVCDGKDVRLPEDQFYYELQLQLVPRDISLEIIRRQMKNKAISIIKNNYPYTRTLKYLPDVTQYCLWSIKGSLDERQIERQASKKFKNKKWFYFERGTGKKSVPELWHCHIFVKG